VKAVLLKRWSQLIKRLLIPWPVAHELHEPLLLIAGSRSTATTHTPLMEP